MEVTQLKTLKMKLLSGLGNLRRISGNPLQTVGFMNNLIRENFDSLFQVHENRVQMNSRPRNSQLPQFQLRFLSRKLLFFL